MVTCMAGGSAACSVVANSNWYWIYYVGPALAAFVVAEITTMMEMDVEDTVVKQNTTLKEEEAPVGQDEDVA